MKKMSLLFFLLTVIVSNSYSQITHLKVLGDSASFTTISGDEFGWSFEVPHEGDTTLVQIWVDADQNGQINTSVDRLWIFFNHIDGDPNGQNGPPDIDGSANKIVSFSGKLGLAPAHYVLLFKNHNQYKSTAGIVTPLVSPAFLLTGTVAVPEGYSKKNIMLSLESENEAEVMFWNALTDENGNFTVQMNSDTAGNPWQLRLNTNFGSAIASPHEYSLIISPSTPNYSGNNFTFTAASASITGTLKDENGNAVIGSEVFFNSNNGNLFRYTQTDTAGVFNLGLLSDELPQSDLSLSAGSNDNPDIVSAFYKIASVKSGDVIDHDMTLFKTNAIITGSVTIDGNPPNFGMQLYCMNDDSGYVNTFTGPNGSFSFNVSSKIYNYRIGPAGEFSSLYNHASILVHPGQLNVIFNISTTDVKDDSNIPAEFSLSRNYPNPFNPVTTINYSIAEEGHVKLTVYNLIGSRVAELVNEDKAAGNYSAEFNASHLPSGIYMYKLESGSFSSARKLILLK